MPSRIQYTGVEVIIICAFSYQKKLPHMTIAEIVSTRRDDGSSVSTEAIRQKLHRLRMSKIDVGTIRQMQEEEEFLDENLQKLLREDDRETLSKLLAYWSVTERLLSTGQWTEAANHERI